MWLAGVALSAVSNPGRPMQPKKWPAARFSSNSTSFTWIGYTMLTDRHRYTEYVVWNGTTLSPVWEQLNTTELYSAYYSNTKL
jgi:hypothetical protein